MGVFELVLVSWFSYFVCVTLTGFFEFAFCNGLFLFIDV